MASISFYFLYVFINLNDNYKFSFKSKFLAASAYFGAGFFLNFFWPKVFIFICQNINLFIALTRTENDRCNNISGDFVALFHRGPAVARLERSLPLSDTAVIPQGDDSLHCRLKQVG